MCAQKDLHVSNICVYHTLWFVYVHGHCHNSIYTYIYIHINVFTASKKKSQVNVVGHLQP